MYFLVSLSIVCIGASFKERDNLNDETGMQKCFLGI
jgi:hypothetical protein